MMRSKSGRRVLGAAVLLAAIAAAATPACGPSTGQLGQGCKSNGIFGSFYCDDGLVCIAQLPPHSDTCGHCSSTDPQALCSLLKHCDNGTCLDCPGGPNNCGAGANGRACLPDGGCASPLVCAGGGCQATSSIKQVLGDDAQAE